MKGWCYRLRPYWKLKLYSIFILIRFIMFMLAVVMHQIQVFVLQIMKTQLPLQKTGRCVKFSTTMKKNWALLNMWDVTIASFFSTQKCACFISFDLKCVCLWSKKKKTCTLSKISFNYKPCFHGAGFGQNSHFSHKPGTMHSHWHLNSQIFFCFFCLSE